MRLVTCVPVVAFGLVCGCGDNRGARDGADVDGASDQQPPSDARQDAPGDATGDTAPVDAGTCETDLVGSWGVTAVEGAPPPPPDSSNSTWIFNADGTYTWCLNYAGFVFDDSGVYDLNGGLLTVDGMVWMLAAENPIPLFDCALDSFRFRDDENAAWTYQRDPAATGCSP